MKNISSFFSQPYDILYLSTIALTIGLCLIIGQCYQGYPLAQDGYRAIYVKRRTTWLRANLTWYAIYFWSVAAGILSPAIVLYITTTDSSSASAEKIIIYSVLGILVSTMSFALNPLKTAFGYREAYRILESVLLETVSDSEEAALPKLSAALRAGEEYITNAMYLTFSPISIQPSAPAKRSHGDRADS